MKAEILFNSEKLTYINTNINDLDVVLSMENHVDNKKYIIPWSRGKHIDTMTDTDKRHVMMEDGEGRTIGYFILSGTKNVHNNIELVRIIVAEKEKGFGKETLRAIQKFVFEELKAHRMWLDVKVHNERAKHIYESLGFKKEGCLRECIRVDDRYESLIVLAILDHEYSKLKEDRDFS